MTICIAIIGPTASGKSPLALELAKTINGELICLDSTTVYKGFDIGTAKPSPEEQKEVPHHLLDILSPEEPFSAYHFIGHADNLISEILARNKVPIVVGGTLFYLRALQHGMYPTQVIPAEVIEGIETEFFQDESRGTTKMHEELQRSDPEAATRIHCNDRYRLVRALAILRTSRQLPSQLKAEPISKEQSERLWLKNAIAISRHELGRNILGRTEKMLKAGLVEETQQLQQEFPNARALNSIGYRESVQFLRRSLTQKQLINEIVEKTRQLAKRQMTWIRSDPEVRYIDRTDVGRIQQEFDNLTFALGSQQCIQ